MRQLRYKRLFILIAMLAVALAWEALILSWPRADFFLPRPTTIIWSFWENKAALFTASLYTCAKIVIGLLLGVVAATLLSLVGVWFPPVRPGLMRCSLWSQTMPVPLLSPLLGLICGYNMWSASVVTALICFFPVYLGWEQGRMALPPDVALLAASYRPSRMSYTCHILVPATLPYALLGVKGAISLAVLGAVIAEFGAAGKGLGTEMLRGIRELTPARSWSAMIILVIVAGSMTSLINRVQRSARFSRLGESHEQPSVI